jgi:formylglycine-generating enzyme required for sulfatase activity
MNVASWNGLDGNVTTVGTNGISSYYGTYDQSGNLFERMENSFVRGGAFNTTTTLGISKAYRTNWSRGNANLAVGFRVATQTNPNSFDNFVAVGNPGNSNDTSGWGQVNYSYEINQFLATNEEYTEFLNSIAETDTNGAYNINMAISPAGGIVRSGSSGSYTYATKSCMADKPVNFVTWYNAARYCNWLHNNKPTGDQTGFTTENGAYTLTGNTGSPTRNPSAKYYLPNENEWYKAAYYNSALAYYFTYATQSDVAPLSVCATCCGDATLDCDQDCGSDSGSGSGSEESGSESGSEESGSGSEESGSGSGSEGSESGSGSGSEGSESGSGSEESGSGCLDCISEYITISWCEVGSGSEESGSEGSEESGSEESGSESGSEESGSGIGSEDNSGGNDGSGSGSGSGSGEIPPIPLPPSEPDQHFRWPPYRFSPEDGSFEEVRGLFDENLAIGDPDGLWTLAYIEKLYEDTMLEGQTQISAIWVKRVSPRLWPTANLFAGEYHIVGSPIGIEADFASWTTRAFSGATFSMQIEPKFISNELPNIEAIGGYFIDIMKWIGDNKDTIDNSYRNMGAGVTTFGSDFYTVSGSYTTEQLDDLTEGLI